MGRSYYYRDARANKWKRGCEKQPRQEVIGVELGEGRQSARLLRH